MVTCSVVIPIVKSTDASRGVGEALESGGFPGGSGFFSRVDTEGKI